MGDKLEVGQKVLIQMLDGKQFTQYGEVIEIDHDSGYFTYQPLNSNKTGRCAINKPMVDIYSIVPKGQLDWMS